MKKWKGLVPVESESTVKKSSPLNSLKSDFKTERCNVSTTPPKLSQNTPKKESKGIKHKEKLVDEKSDIQGNKAVKKQHQVTKVHVR